MKRDHDTHEEFGLSSFQDDKLISGLSRIIRLAVRFLAVLMTFVIVWGVWDVVWVLCERLMAPPFMLLEMMYLKDNVIHVNLVIATALMAIARKVIVLDTAHVESAYIFAIAAVVLALSVSYWLLHKTAPLAWVAARKAKDERA